MGSSQRSLTVAILLGAAIGKWRAPLHYVNSLIPDRYQNNFNMVIFKLIFQLDILGKIKGKNTLPGSVLTKNSDAIWRHYAKIS